MSNPQGGPLEVGKPADSVSETQQLKQAETLAAEALRTDLNLPSDAVARNTVHALEAADAQKSGHTTETVIQDLTRMSQLLTTLSMPNAADGTSPLQRIVKGEFGPQITESLNQTRQLAQQVAASFETGSIKPGADVQPAVVQLLKQLTAQKTGA